jgi:quinol-cytochrome oxidoreductase complex cytochrome b subunit
VFGLALVAFVLMGWHLFRVRRDGGISHQKREPRVNREVLVRTELIAALLTLAALVGLSVIADAPLGPPADPTALVEEPSAPWFFLWVQELLRVTSPFVAGVLTPVVILALISALPYTLDRSDDGIGQWFNQAGRRAQVAFLLLIVIVVLLTLRGTLR